MSVLERESARRGTEHSLPRLWAAIAAVLTLLLLAVSPAWAASGSFAWRTSPALPGAQTGQEPGGGVVRVVYFYAQDCPHCLAIDEEVLQPLEQRYGTSLEIKRIEMIIATASGKGGTGKTTVATGLALSIAGDGHPARLLFLDCDVEEPNAALFLKPTFDHREQVGIPIPHVDFDRCTYCGRCAEVCAWHAIAVVGKKVLIFPELCHGCGSCTLSCPETAISEVLHVMGTLESGQVGPIGFGQGTLDVGQAMAVPIIRQLKKKHHTPKQLWLPARRRCSAPGWCRSSSRESPRGTE